MYRLRNRNPRNATVRLPLATRREYSPHTFPAPIRAEGTAIWVLTMYFLGFFFFYNFLSLLYVVKQWVTIKM